MYKAMQPDGSIRFRFQEVVESDTPADVVRRYGRDFVHYCFAENADES